MAVRSLLRASRGGRSRSSPIRPASRSCCVHVDFQPGFDGDGGIDARAYRALRPGRPRGPLAAGDRSRGARRARAACATAPGPGSRSAPSSCSSSPRCFYPLLGPTYPWHEHIVTAGKYVEYALLAPAARADRPAARGLRAARLHARRLERRRDGARRRAVPRLADRQRLAGRLPAAVVPRPPRLRRALGRRAGGRARGDRAARRGASTGGSRRRQESPARSACSSPDRRAGAIGLVAAAAVAAAIVARRSLRRVGRGRSASPSRSSAASSCFRGGDVKSFLHFAGIGHKQEQTGVETYVQRTMLVYYGWRVFVDHPVAGAGWQASNDEYVYGPLLPRAAPRVPERRPRSASRRPRTPTGSRTPTSRRSPTSASSALRALPRPRC